MDYSFGQANKLGKIKGELSSQLYPTFYCLEIKSLVIAFEQKKPRQKILLFG